jgi:hypothetical protein
MPCISRNNNGHSIECANACFTTTPAPPAPAPPAPPTPANPTLTPTPAPPTPAKPTPANPTLAPPTPAKPGAANECNPSKTCNVCESCCQSFIPDGKSCDDCVKQKCPVVNECNPTKGCNVCQTCCQSFIADGKPCDDCAHQKCSVGCPLHHRQARTLLRQPQRRSVTTVAHGTTRAKFAPIVLVRGLESSATSGTQV